VNVLWMERLMPRIPATFVGIALMMVGFTISTTEDLNGVSRRWEFARADRSHIEVLWRASGEVLPSPMALKVNRLPQKEILHKSMKSSAKRAVSSIVIDRAKLNRIRAVSAINDLLKRRESCRVQEGPRSAVIMWSKGLKFWNGKSLKRSSVFLRERIPKLTSHGRRVYRQDSGLPRRNEGEVFV
jgi:hypothetical protein